MKNEITSINLNKTFEIIRNRLKTGADRISVNNFSKNIDIKFKLIEQEINNFTFKVHKYKKIQLNKDRVVYIPTVKDQVVSYTLKKILDNRLKIKYPNRNSIIEDLEEKINEILKTNENNKFNFIKLDIKKCFDNISKPQLFRMLGNSNLIQENEYYLIKQFLKYQNKGIPQGVCLSSFLIEFYFRNLDKELKRISPKICYYSRYVDDIIIVFNDFFSYTEQKKITEEIYSIFKKYQLKINKDKSLNLENFTNSSLTYLGYEFMPSNNKLKIEICKKKLDLIFKKIDFCFEQYLYNNNKILLHERLRYILINNHYKKRKIYTNKKFNIYSKRIKIKLGVFNIYKQADSIKLQTDIKKYISKIIKQPSYKNVKTEIVQKYLSVSLFDKYFQHANSRDKSIKQLKILKMYKPCHNSKNPDYLKKIYLKKIIIKI